MPIPHKDIVGHVRHFCLKQELFSKGDKLLLAVSGGPDSIALFHIFYRLSIDFDLEISIAHLNHQLREDDSTLDQLFVKKTAESHDIRFYTENASIPLLKQRGESAEEAARRIRYDFLFETLRRINYDRIATGHTLDDNVETIIYRLISGTGPSGFAGISPKSTMIIHPLLTLSKEQIINYLNINGLSYRIDKTNFDTAIPRNRIRYEIIPQMSRINRRFKEHTLSLVGILREENEFLNKLVDEKIKSLMVGKTEDIISVHYNRFFLLENPLKRRIIIRLFEQLIPTTNLAKKVVLPFKVLYNLCSVRVTGNKVLYQNSSITIIKEYDTLLIKKSVVDTVVNKYLYFVHSVSKPLRISEIDRELVFSLRESIQFFERNKLYFDFDRVTLPITVRNRRAGDRIVLKKVGSKKVKNLFIDHKVPSQIREAVPILESDRKIIGVFCSLYGKDNRVSEYFRITDETKRICTGELI